MCLTSDTTLLRHRQRVYQPRLGNSIYVFDSFIICRFIVLKPPYFLTFAPTRLGLAIIKDGKIRSQSRPKAGERIYVVVSAGGFPKFVRTSHHFWRD